MKPNSILFISFCLIITHIVSSQELSNYDSLKLKICASQNIDTWAKQDGQYEYINEFNQIVFDFNHLEDNFKSKLYFKSKKYQRTKGDSIIKETKDSAYRNYTTNIPEKLINVLIKEISINKCCDLQFLKDSIYIEPNCCRLSNKDFEIEKKWLKQNINRKEILKRAKRLDVKWSFGNEYSMKENRLKVFKGYSNIDSLNLFLNDMPRPTHFFTTHTSQRFQIELISANDTIFSLTKIIMPSKTQTPWIDNTTGNEIYNPKINLIIDQLIPKTFLYKNSIKYDFIKESYIDWILERW